MRARILAAAVGVTLAGAPAWAQMHKVAKPQQVVRAVGVYEWTGDLAKPTASRLVPISLFIHGEFQDAGVYLPQPVPFALESGNIYELKQAGAAAGSITLESARHLQTASGDDDGWFGSGSFKPLPASKPVIAKKLPPARTSGIVSSVKDTAEAERPTFARTADGERTAGAPEPTQQASAAPQPAAASQPDTPSSSDGIGSTPADDPDRPVLKRRTPEEQKQAQAQGDVQARSDAPGMVASLNNDPDRPILHLGKPGGDFTGAGVPQLAGTPPEMHQMVAVSDAVDRQPHLFARAWADPAERAAVLQKIEAMAQTKLAAYVAKNDPDRPVAKKTKASRRSRRKATAAPAPEALMDEVLKSYTLSYGGDPTYIYMAHTAGAGAALHYVTVVAQTDEMGQMNEVLASVTDEAHLNRTPRMKFVDVVDADASNRASLLFELRAHSARQFALYRVIAGRAQQIFLSDPTQ